MIVIIQLKNYSYMFTFWNSRTQNLWCSNFPVVWSSFKTGSLPLKEQHNLQDFKNKVLNKVFVHGRDEVNGKFMILCNEKLCGLYRPSSIVRTVKSRMLSAGHVAGMGETSTAYILLVGRCLGKSPCGDRGIRIVPL